MTRIRPIALAVLLALCPAVAQAQDGGFWEWLEKLSGPGPFKNGWMASLRVACFLSKDTPGATAAQNEAPATNWFYQPGPDSEDNYPCLKNSRTVRAYVQLRVGHIETGQKAVFNDTPTDIRNIGANTVEGVIMTRLNRAVAVGAGVGLMWFTGPDFNDVHATTFTPISVALSPLVVVAPGQGWTRILVVRYDETYIAGDLTAAKFKSPSQYSTKGEYTRRIAVLFDLGAASSKKY